MSEEDIKLIPKTSSKPARGGWGPGSYFKVCRNCRDRFLGDPAAVVCADCAYTTPGPLCTFGDYEPRPGE